MAQKNSVPVKVEKLSGFDKSHKVLTTLRCGTLTPLLTDELIPGSKVDLKLNLAAQLPPLASDVYARMCIKAEAFFVPHRIVYGGYQDFMMANPIEVIETDGGSGLGQVSAEVKLPSLKVKQKDFMNGGLLDQLGCRFIGSSTTSTVTRNINPFPILAYHKIWDDWYRNSLIQKPCFVNTMQVSGEGQDFPETSFIDNVPYRTYWESPNDVYPGAFTSDSTFLNGVGILDMHQRNFDSDYFTNATPSAQSGQAQKVSTLGNNFTIESLRLANSLQKFAERNNLAGTQWVDWLHAQYGVSPSDGIAQRSLYLGSAKFNIYNKGVYSAADADPSTSELKDKNPFISSVGGQVGSAYAEGSSFIINNFTATEPGTLMVIVSLVPEGVSYSSGSNRLFRRYTKEDASARLDLANAMLAGTGNQPIYNNELSSVEVNATDSIFGYTERFADWKTMTDRVSGGFRDDSNTFYMPTGQKGLSHFVLQRSLKGYNQISSKFLEIPLNFMDGITLYTNALTQYGCCLDTYLEYKLAMPLPEYCQPSLESSDEEHQNTVYVSRNGSKL